MDDILIQIKHGDIDVYREEEVIFESSETADRVNMLEGLLAALGFNVEVIDLCLDDDELLPDDCKEPFYEEDHLANLTDE